MTRLGIIGGSGFDQLPEFEIDARTEVSTPYGSPSSALISGRLNDMNVVFIARHGEKHKLAPHCINYRANLYALMDFGVVEVVAFAAVGGINAEIDEAAIVIPHQVIDCTWGREHTFYDGMDTVKSDFAGRLEHVDFSYPYSPGLRSRLLDCAHKAGVAVIDGAVYAVTQGPRLETAAEIDRLDKSGADIVGMTGMPEAALARELGMEYACIALVVNPAAGRGSGEISMELIYRNLEKASSQALAVVKALG